MNEVIWIVLAFIGGIGLGFLFFGGLWLTVKKASKSKIPALWFFGSLALRLAVVLVGFYYLGLGDLFQLITCLLGFIIARFIVLQLTKSYDLKQKEKVITHGA